MLRLARERMANIELGRRAAADSMDQLQSTVSDARH